MKKIVLTGGGSAGHVTPNIALTEELKKEDWDIAYIGSPDGVEREMITALSIPYYAVRSGKLRRYFSWKSFLEPFNIVFGIAQAYFLLKKLNPQLVFSKGGFVAFPVVVGAWMQRIPVLAHESDFSPGLANRLSFPFVDKICVNFSAAKKHFKRVDKVEVTGTPLRSFLFHGNKEKALARCGFNAEKPCLLIIGGSLGAQKINDCVRKALAILCQDFQVIHLCGKGKVDTQLMTQAGYCQFEYANEDLADFFAASELVISRAGANAVCEMIALAKPHVFIPLSEKVSRGDQVQNARYFEEQGISVVLKEENLSVDTLLSAIRHAQEQRELSIKKMQDIAFESASQKVMTVIKGVLDVKNR